MKTRKQRLLAIKAEQKKRYERFGKVIGQDETFYKLLREAQRELKAGNILIAGLCLSLIENELRGHQATRN